MASYYDKNGNIYQIEDTKVLVEKEHIEVWDESGKEFALPAKLADELKLTPAEKAKVVNELSARIAELLRALGGGGGCPNIDPPGLGSIVGTQVLPQFNQSLNPMLRIPFGGGCPAIDPVSIGSILGTQIFGQQAQALANLFRAWGGGCPAIDPAQLGSILGTIGQWAAPQANLAERAGSQGCPNIDPANLGSILGTLAQAAFRRPAGIFDFGLGGGCPAIDPFQIGTLLGTLGALRNPRT